MPLIYGKGIIREAYLRRVGNPRQCFVIHPIAYTSGRESLIRAFDVDNAGGLRFAVCESKGMDLLNLSYRGINFGFETKAGISSLWIADEQGMAYRGSLARDSCIPPVFQMLTVPAKTAPFTITHMVR